MQCKTEDKRQKSEGRGQAPEARSQRPEARGQDHRTVRAHTLHRSFPQEQMKRLILLGALLLALPPALGKESKIKCPGENTVEMRYCADLSWGQSNDQLKRKVSRKILQQWQEATRSVCAHAYAPYKDGTIYPQLVVGCDDRLNRSLLKEFKPMDAP